jgi:NADPH:quinone reductase-like Zn-dependent oxidoreductase
VIAESKQVETGLMKAVVRERYGSPDVFQIKELERPTPDDVRNVLVKIYASSVNPADRYDMSPPFMIRLVSPVFRLGIGARRPRSPGLGSDFAGRVEAVGSNVTQYEPGDEVFGVCDSAYAEYATANGNQNRA